MDKYIRLDDAIMQIQRYGVGCFDEEDFIPEQAERFVIAKLKEISIDDIQPVKHGKWVRINRGYRNPLTGTDGVYIGCSNCRAPIPTDSLLDYLDQSECAFCYSCGAKMEEE